MHYDGCVEDVMIKNSFHNFLLLFKVANFFQQIEAYDKESDDDNEEKRDFNKYFTMPVLCGNGGIIQ
jgi:hypothetical protein